jgi:hypothetical protein
MAFELDVEELEFVVFERLTRMIVAPLISISAGTSTPSINRECPPVT